MSITKFEVIRDRERCRNHFYINGEDVTNHVVNYEYKKDAGGVYRLVVQLEFYNNFELNVSEIKKADEKQPQCQSTLTEKKKQPRGLKELLRRR